VGEDAEPDPGQVAEGDGKGEHRPQDQQVVAVDAVVAEGGVHVREERAEQHRHADAQDGPDGGDAHGGLEEDPDAEAETHGVEDVPAFAHVGEERARW
jgi:hypothetical protein